VVFANFPHNVNILVAEIIKDGDSIMLDTGSTTAYVARALSEQRNLSVVTNCAEAGTEYIAIGATIATGIALQWKPAVRRFGQARDDEYRV
jgi:DeoR/GlpR family transcriptional regulator of sugar metabolism